MLPEFVLDARVEHRLVALVVVVGFKPEVPVPSLPTGVLVKVGEKAVNFFGGNSHNSVAVGVWKL